MKARGVSEIQQESNMRLGPVRDLEHERRKSNKSNKDELGARGIRCIRP
jgi:hypothetical protein